MIKINFVNQYDKKRSYKKIVTEVLKKGYKDLELHEKAIISVILVDNPTIHELNKQYRNIDKPTDVLSFENDSDIYEIGDVFISIDKVIEQAKDLDHSFEYELAFLSVHGFLHCLGYDHIEDSDEIEMTRKQNKIMKDTKYTR
ncbi:rRNA maturation RNase YbeY [Mycoplasmatota bacterium WC30]